MPSTRRQPQRAPSFSHIYNSDVIESPLSDTPLSDFLSPFRPASTQWVARYTFISFALILRLAVGLGPYSGYKIEPMHGDFEAQRHWLEITNHLPIKDWYFFDLQWWGLDYPPLTAYHSWLLGFIGKLINPRWFELNASRGLDDYDLKSYMRATALFSELAIYIPAVISYVRWVSKQRGVYPIAQSLSAAAILFQPALILIDHGHFQYNSVMLGLALLAIVNLQYKKNLTACFFFVAALMFKQMALYYAPVIFAYLLGVCVFPKIDIWRLVTIGLATVSSFVVLLAPLLVFGGVATLQQMVVRIFPFSRGLWEDKVANVWCTANTFIKLKYMFTNEELQRLSLIATLAAIAPAMLIIFLRPKRHLLPWAFASCSWAFYLFSFQVHEKSVLLPLMPTTLLIASQPASSHPRGQSKKSCNSLPLIFWINNVAMFSMWPLLQREGLQLQYFVMTLCWNWLVGNFNFLTHEHKLQTYLLPSSGFFWRSVLVLSYAAMAFYHAVELLLPAPAKYPDIYPVANITISCGCFGLFWLYTLYKLYSLSSQPEPKPRKSK
ncbi:uncharacterized protein SAPINGB_P004142 [Magnusiomyces paraingens]|uniref:Alpha-1,3-glucosyltransferase n=1 Tax=Magnusiomyces paraingens TaxID=2606893 RepID=A0A5E8BTZ2_9ASCO|nr:uncharacterized protein SAPINGB_P004142 [Saprochaete ingens]VVT54571.1 unnamed protein product [Saprochaete ingens]